MIDPIPVVLFAYNRPGHLRRTLEHLRANHVPLLYAFSDGARTVEHEPAVAEVRGILRSIDWCELVLVERSENLGLGASIRTGVSDVLRRHTALIVFEDDLIAVPGTYEYLCAALHYYQDAERVMSVTGWTHPRVTPPDVGNNPYFDGRGECLVWGTWARAWQGMERTALELMQACRARGIDIRRYGDDLPKMAHEEQQRNIWAVRWLYLHLLQGALCLRPSHSLVEHIGFDAQATNAKHGSIWVNPPLPARAPMPQHWPAPVEHPAVARLWRRAIAAEHHPVRRIISWLQLRGR